MNIIRARIVLKELFRLKLAFKPDDREARNINKVRLCGDGTIESKFRNKP